MAQKLSREGTVAFEQLQELKKLNKPELFKMASALGLDNLVMVTKSWKIGYTNLPINDLSLGGRFFGQFKLNFSHMSRATTNNDNGIYGVLRDQGNEVALVSTYNRSDGSSRGNSVNSEYIGFADTMHVLTYPDNENAAVSMTVSFIGYEVGLPLETILNNIVTNEGYKLADNLGNIISIP